MDETLSDASDFDNIAETEADDNIGGVLTADYDNNAENGAEENTDGKGDAEE